MVNRGPVQMACWRFLLLACCLLVFLFTLHAKVSVYQQNHVDTSTSSKLWVSGERHEPQPVSTSVVIFWFAAVLVFLLYQESEHLYDAVGRAPAQESRSQLYLRRFLRPPPVR